MKALLLLLLAVISVHAADDPQFAAREPRYRLQLDDKFEVQYRFTPEFNTTVAVEPDGFVTLPLVGQVKVAGLTLDAARREIEKKAGERLNAPEVNLVLRDYLKPFFVVAGEVTKPGRYDLRGRITTVEAVAQGGGFKESAKHTQVVLVRKVDAEHAELKLLDMRKMMSGKGVIEDVELRSGDMLIVPKNTISRMEPYLRLGTTALYALLLGLTI